MGVKFDQTECRAVPFLILCAPGLRLQIAETLIFSNLLSEIIIRISKLNVFKSNVKRLFTHSRFTGG